MLIRILPDDSVVKSEMGFSLKEEKLYAQQNENSGFRFIESLPYSKHNFWKIENSVIVADEVKNNAKDKELRYHQLEKILSEKWLGIQAIAIDKEWMTDPQAIQAQIDSYSKLADGAREILKNDPANETALGIVAKADEAKILTYDANKLMQTVKTILATKISENDQKIDKKLSFARGFKMTKADIQDANKSAEIATQLIDFLMS